MSKNLTAKMDGRDESDDLAQGESASGSSAPEEVPETGDAGGAGDDLASLTEETYRDLVARAAERDKFLDELRRARADFENFQKRIRRERPDWEKNGLRQLAADLLPIQDNFERALEGAESSASEAFREGVELIRQELLRALEAHDIRPMKALGEPFDPKLHDAVQQIETDDESDGLVVEVVQKGYLHGDVVLRPARVVVGRKREAVPDTFPEAE